ncbi:elongation factor EF-2 [Candidatus Bathyarchaeota archaeon]|nr:elongation factor EF-2 [Candidatus Bathyarchaeota archaeon]
MPRFKTTTDILKIIKNKDQIRNTGIIAHIDHGKTTLTDSLLAEAGLISPTIAGEARVLDYLEEEQKRGITIKAANISLYYERKGNPTLINMIDTPGHVDFSGRVTRSLRAIDGAVVVVDAVEEVMVQTETVTRQALEERVKPVLYINKIDRLIKELRLTPEKIQEKLGRIIQDFNRLIEMYAEPEFKEKWKVNPAKGTVAFGSAKDRWGITTNIAEKIGLTFSDIINAYKKNEVDALVKKAPVASSILDMITTKMPPPHVAQKYRVSKIWRGDLNSKFGRAMLDCDDNGPAIMSVVNINVDPRAGVVATGRLFSGTLNPGDTLYLIDAKTESRIQQVSLYMGAQREIIDSINAGNIPALLGLPKARAGETLSSVPGITPFEAIKYVTEPVMTMAIEPRYSRELPKLINTLRRLSIEDPTLVTKIDEESGEYLISGMGQLHLEISTLWIEKAGIEIVKSKPIVIYRETIQGSGGPFESRSPNRHNKIFTSTEALDLELVKMIKNRQLREGKDKTEIVKTLRDHGWTAKEAKGVWAIDERGNILTEITKGIQRLDQVKGSIIIGFMDAMAGGPFAGEPVRGVKVKLEDASIHEDHVHFGPAQIIPATRRGIFAAMLTSDITLLEPLLKINIKIPIDYVGTVSSLIAQKRGKTLSVEQREHLTYVTGELAASETFDLSEAMRSATGGRAFWGTEFSRWGVVPSSIQKELVKELRKRRGLSPSPPTVKHLLKP